MLRQAPTPPFFRPVSSADRDRKKTEDLETHTPLRLDCHDGKIIAAKVRVHTSKGHDSVVVEAWNAVC
eukprot:scaffold123264_cov31-Tisochrysis_lutea.AAC.1